MPGEIKARWVGGATDDDDIFDFSHSMQVGAGHVFALFSIHMYIEGQIYFFLFFFFYKKPNKQL